MLRQAAAEAPERRRRRKRPAHLADYAGMEEQARPRARQAAKGAGGPGVPAAQQAQQAQLRLTGQAEAQAPAPAQGQAQGSDGAARTQSAQPEQRPQRVIPGEQAVQQPGQPGRKLVATAAREVKPERLALLEAYQGAVEGVKRARRQRLEAAGQVGVLGQCRRAGRARWGGRGLGVHAGSGWRR